MKEYFYNGNWQKLSSNLLIWPMHKSPHHDQLNCQLVVSANLFWDRADTFHLKGNVGVCYRARKKLRYSQASIHVSLSVKISSLQLLYVSLTSLENVCYLELHLCINNCTNQTLGCETWKARPKKCLDSFKILS